MSITSATDLFEGNILPTPYHILGQDLFPFSVGHAFLFQKLGLNVIATPENLLSAILVCCHTYSEFERNLNEASFHKRIRQWSKVCSKAFKTPGRFEAALKTFHDYMEEGTAQPDFDIVSANRGGDTESKTPFLQHLRAVLISRLNYRPNEVMQASFSQAIWDYRAYFELEGAIVIRDGRPGENTAALFENADERIAEAVKRHAELTKRN